jgi:hypothetical protein
MTFDEIVKKLQDQRLDYLLSALDRAVEEEARALRALEPKRKQTQKWLQGTFDQAKEYFAEDITKYLAMGDVALTPEQVLNHRRIPTAWAVAKKMQSNTLTCPYCGGALELRDRPNIYDYPQQKQYGCVRFVCPAGHHILIVESEVTNG